MPADRIVTTYGWVIVPAGTFGSGTLSDRSSRETYRMIRQDRTGRYWIDYYGAVLEVETPPGGEVSADRGRPWRAIGRYWTPTQRAR